MKNRAITYSILGGILLGIIVSVINRSYVVGKFVFDLNEIHLYIAQGMGFIVWSIILSLIPSLIIKWRKKKFPYDTFLIIYYITTFFIAFVLIYSNIMIVDDNRMRNQNQEISEVNQERVKGNQTENELMLDGDKDIVEYFDTLSNTYSNYKYGFSLLIPKNWDIDKGFSKNTIIRALERDSAMTLSITVIDVGGKESDSFSIWDYYDSNKDNYENQYRESLEASIGSPIYEFQMRKVYYSNFEALQIEYISENKHLGAEYFMQSIAVQIAKFSMVFGINIHIPLVFYDENESKYLSLLDRVYVHPKKRITE